jgi:SAM-dependent methyltransferase
VTEDYLQINRANWDSRAPIHSEAPSYEVPELLADPQAISKVVAFDLPRLGELTGLDVVHLQCHIGTDTLSLHRLGAASVTGVDLSPASLTQARRIADAAGVAISYVESDVYSAPAALGRQFDLVYTGIGAICWLPRIDRWAQVVAELLRPGGRLFIRDGHPVLNALLPTELGPDPIDRQYQPHITGAGGSTISLELPYFEQAQWLMWSDESTYAGPGQVGSPTAVEWNHSVSEIITAVMDAGLHLTSFVEHDSTPWEAFPGQMTLDAATGEWRLIDRAERLPATFTLTATKP